MVQAYPDGTELTALDGKFEVVSKDVLLLKDAINNETAMLSRKIDETKTATLDRVEHLFENKFIKVIGRIVACASGMYGAAVFLRAQGLSDNTVGILAFIAAVAIWIVVGYVTNRNS